MIHATWGGPSGIVHGWVPAGGDERRGYVPVCYPNGAHPGWYMSFEEVGGRLVLAQHGQVHGHHDVPEYSTEDPITCLRCLKRLGRKVRVVVTRRVVPDERNPAHRARPK